MTTQALQALKGASLTPLERLLALGMLYRFEEWLSIESLLPMVYGEDFDGGPDHASSSLAHISRKLSVKLQKSALKLERRHGLRRLTWRKDLAE